VLTTIPSTDSHDEIRFHKKRLSDRAGVRTVIHVADAVFPVLLCTVGTLVVLMGGASIVVLT